MLYLEDSFQRALRLADWYGAQGTVTDCSGNHWDLQELSSLQAQGRPMPEGMDWPAEFDVYLPVAGSILHIQF